MAQVSVLALPLDGVPDPSANRPRLTLLPPGGASLPAASTELGLGATALVDGGATLRAGAAGCVVLTFELFLREQCHADGVPRSSPPPLFARARNCPSPRCSSPRGTAAIR